MLGPTDYMPRQRPRLQPTSLIELAKLGHRLLNDPPANPHAAHKTPIAMNLPVLPPRRVAQVHALITTQPSSKENGDGRHYTPLPTSFASQPLDPAHPACSKKEKPTSNCASWVWTTTFTGHPNVHEIERTR